MPTPMDSTGSRWSSRAAALPVAKEGWHRFPDADDDCGGVFVCATEYMDEGLYRRIDVPGGVVYIQIWDLLPSNLLGHTCDAREWAREYIKMTDAPEKEVEVVVSGGTSCISADVLVIYPNQLTDQWRSGVRGTMVCASRGGLGYLSRSPCPKMSTSQSESDQEAEVELQRRRGVVKTRRAMRSRPYPGTQAVKLGSGGVSEYPMVAASAASGAAATSATGSAAIGAAATSAAARGVAATSATGSPAFGAAATSAAGTAAAARGVAATSATGSAAESSAVAVSASDSRSSGQEAFNSFQLRTEFQATPDF